MKDQERTPLRTILLNFLNHIENLEAHRSSEDSYETEFQELKLFSEALKSLKQYSCSEGEKEVNRKKNRYKDILPFDLSRVILNEYAGIPGSDYINANYIKGASGSPAYIASQGPLPHTVNDFWRMVVQCEVQVIVMACNEEEAGKHKCENYWVEGEGEEKQFGMVTIRLVKASTICPDFSVRTMRLKYTNTLSNTEERTVCQFHYSAWPDHGVPPLVRPLLDMVRLVRDTQASETLPVLVHCSAGCGRTGTICAIDYVWGLLRAGKLTKDFSLLSLVREMRRQRIAMVQTKEQYVLVHRAVRELFKEQLRMIDSHPYENIDCNGMPIDSEPTYDVSSNEEKSKKDDKEKEVSVIAPPLPQKKRFAVLSSKHEKEVENLSEKQRTAEQAESSNESSTSSSIGHRPRIAKLKSLFERESKQVSRSHSLGAPRKPQVFRKEPVAPVPTRGILRLPQTQEQTEVPSVAVKRSKSLRVLGSIDRYKLSIPTEPSPGLDDKSRRLSLESNMDVHEKDERQEGKKYFSKTNADSVVAGLAVRERRNSFREAVNKTGLDYENVPRKPITGGLVRSYTAIDIRPLNWHDFPVKPDVSKPVAQVRSPFLTYNVNSNQSLVDNEVLRRNKTAESVEPKKSKPVPKFESHISAPLRKSFNSLNVDTSSKSSHPSSSMKAGLAKKDQKVIQSSPQMDESVSPHYVNIRPDNYTTDISKPEGIYRMSPDTPRTWRRIQPFDKRIPNQVKSNTPIQFKSEQNQRGHVQVNNTTSFGKEAHPSPPSYGETTAHYNTSFKQIPSSRKSVQTPVRFHNSRHVIYDATNASPMATYKSHDEHKYMASRCTPGKEMTEKLHTNVQKPSRQLHQQIGQPRHVYSDYQQDISKVSGWRQTDASPSHYKISTPRGGSRQNFVPVDHRHVQHYSEVKMNYNAPTGTMNEYRLNPKTPNNSEFRIMNTESLQSNDNIVRTPEFIGTPTTSSAEHYKSPPPCPGSSHQQPVNTPRMQMAADIEHIYDGVKPRRGSQDDLALCSVASPVVPSRIKRNASVVLRHSFNESSDTSPQLTIWNSAQTNGDGRGTTTVQNIYNKESEDPWSGAVGVDLDQVAASMTSQKDGSSSKLMKAALQALHQRKSGSSSGEQKSPEHKYGVTGQQHSPSVVTSPGQPPFRKQQQYL